MDKILKCGDTGLLCEFVMCGQTEREILGKAKEHARVWHDMTRLSLEFYRKARAAIHEGDCRKINRP